MPSLGGLIATFTVSPALSALLLPDRVSEAETLVVRGLHRLYRPVLGFALANRIVDAGRRRRCCSALAAARGARPRARIPAESGGGQFLDPRHHAALDLARGGQRLRQPHAPRHQELSRGRHRRLAARPARRRHRRDRLLQRRVLRAAEAVRPMAGRGRQGEADRRAERTRWKRNFPGVDFNFSQYIEDNVEEAASGVKGENSVKLFGNDLARPRKDRRPRSRT